MPTKSVVASRVSTSRACASSAARCGVMSRNMLRTLTALPFSYPQVARTDSTTRRRCRVRNTPSNSPTFSPANTRSRNALYASAYSGVTVTAVDTVDCSASSYPKTFRHAWFAYKSWPSGAVISIRSLAVSRKSLSRSSAAARASARSCAAYASLATAESNRVATIPTTRTAPGVRGSRVVCEITTARIDPPTSTSHAARQLTAHGCRPRTSRPANTASGARPGGAAGGTGVAGAGLDGPWSTVVRRYRRQKVTPPAGAPTVSP